jgi:exodeoxyribonuclease VII large subunit
LILKQRDNRTIYSVGEINRLAGHTLETEFGDVWIEGELSRVTRSQPGHIYFTLKDDTAVLNAAFFRGSQRGLTFDLKDGLKVRAYGRLTIYGPRGNYQIVIQKVEEAGQGSLQEAFEKLKKQLAAEGLFDEERKKPLPLLPRHVGIVTSPTGAALRDILQVLARRFPNLHVVIAPAQVQGAGAAEQIAEGIRQLHQLGSLDVIIVGRGGGSIEDLWAFNEEAVARAIAASTLPVISAVGHEIDFTISDFVADVRAPTPSAAAEIVVGRKEAFEERVRDLGRQLGRSLQAAALELKHRLTAAAESYVFREPRNLVRRYTERIDVLHERMRQRAQTTLQQGQQRVDEAGLRLAHRVETNSAAQRQRLRRLEAQLAALSPHAVLTRGFSITRTADGRVVRTAEEVSEGDTVETLLGEGRIASRVTKTTKGEPHG